MVAARVRAAPVRRKEVLARSARKTVFQCWETKALEGARAMGLLEGGHRRAIDLPPQNHKRGSIAKLKKHTQAIQSSNFNPINSTESSVKCF